MTRPWPCVVVVRFPRDLLQHTTKCLSKVIASDIACAADASCSQPTSFTVPHHRYCKSSKSGKQLSKVAMKALALHPTSAALWTYTAAWEFEDNANAGAARALMQQGLRACKNDEGMWLEYFKMELLYVQKLRARRTVLGIDNHGEALRISVPGVVWA